jgi:hypothetical protein
MVSFTCHANLQPRAISCSEWEEIIHPMATVMMPSRYLKACPFQSTQRLVQNPALEIFPAVHTPSNGVLRNGRALTGSRLYIAPFCFVVQVGRRHHRRYSESRGKIHLVSFGFTVIVLTDIIYRQPRAVEPDTQSHRSRRRAQWVVSCC